MNPDNLETQLEELMDRMVVEEPAPAIKTQEFHAAPKEHRRQATKEWLRVEVMLQNKINNSVSI